MGSATPRDLIHKRDGPSDMVDDRHISYLFPRHGHVLQQLQYSVWHVLESSEEGRRGGEPHTPAADPYPKVHSLVVSELAVGHVAMITDDLPHMLWGHVFLLSLHKSELALLTVTLGL